MKWARIKDFIEIEKNCNIKARSNFDCGEKTLNDFISKFAKNNAKVHAGQTHILYTLEGSLKIIGYFTLSNLSVEKRMVSDFKFPTMQLPSVLIGRIAVDKKEQGKSFSRVILIKALEIIMSLSNDTGIKLVVVDALNEKIVNYYLKFGFNQFIENNLRLYMTIDTVQELLEE